jgi:hypothetical protein
LLPWQVTQAAEKEMEDVDAFDGAGKSFEFSLAHLLVIHLASPPWRGTIYYHPYSYFPLQRPALADTPPMTTI